MGNLKLFYKQSIRYFFLFAIAVFLVSSIFVCHIYTVEAADFTYDFSDSCLDEEEILASQDKTQNNQRLTPDFNSKTSEKSFSLIQQKDAFFISSEDSSNSQAIQLLAVVKIE